MYNIQVPPPTFLLLKSTDIKLLCQIGVKILNAYSQFLDLALCGLVSRVRGLAWVQDHAKSHLDTDPHGDTWHLGAAGAGRRASGSSKGENGGPASSGCCNNVPRSARLQTIELHSLIVPKARSSMSKCL